MVTPVAKREAVAHLQGLLDVSERRACRIIAADRSVVRYERRREDDAGLRERLRDLAHQRRRFGYRHLHILLRRDGITINRKKTQRLYREEGLTVRRRKGRKRVVGCRAPAPVAALPNQRWSLDFVHDQLPTGRRFRVFNVVDDVTRECLAAICRYVDFGQAGCARTDRPDHQAWQAGHDRQRQRHGVDLECGAGMVRRSQDRVALHHAGQTYRERIRRKLQQADA